MDFSPNLHHQLLQLENQLLLDSGSNHVWSPDITLLSSSDFESNCDFEDLNPANVDAERFTSLQHYYYNYYYSHASSKDKNFGEGKVEKEGSASCVKSNETLKTHYCSSFEDLNKIAQSCCCTKIHPTVNVSSRKPLMAELSSSLGFDHSLSLANSNSHHHLFQQSTTSPLPTKVPNCEITPTKRTCILKQQNSTQLPSKKMRVESRATCPPLKIRKDKLGDRIGALQQLVSPFGKTDTASVLMESISYINFLQNQVEMLSHCYMKSHRTKNYKNICQDELNEKNKKQESDLKVKGLCLVPLTWVSYLPEDTTTGGRIGSIWPPLPAASFNRRTF